MRLATLIIVAVIIFLQWPVWLGKGSWSTVLQLQDDLVHQREANQKLTARNDSLHAEVVNLKTGYDAVEERARSELGMIKQDEVFFQVLKPGSIVRPPPQMSASAATATLTASSVIASAATAAPTR